MIYSQLSSSKGESQGLVIFSHGIGEHSGLYETFSNYIVEAGFDFLSYDIRGHGLSDGFDKKTDFSIYIEDLEILIKKHQKKDQKVFLIGHSFGAIISNYYATKFKVDGVISIGYQHFILKKIKYLGFLMPNKKLVFNWQDPRSRTFKDKKDYEDPKLLKFIKFKYIYQALYKGNKYIIKHINQINSPYLIIHGGADLIVDLSNACTFFKRLNTKKDIIIYPNTHHDVLLDVDKMLVYSDIVSWLKQQQ